jgi:hypothetical protein
MYLFAGEKGLQRYKNLDADLEFEKRIKGTENLSHVMATPDSRTILCSEPDASEEKKTLTYT